MALGRKELVQKVKKELEKEYLKGEIPPYLVREALEEILSLIMEGIKEQGVVKLQGFGKFQKRETKNQKGRDFREGSPLSLPPRKTVVFRPSARLLEQLNR